MASVASPLVACLIVDATGSFNAVFIISGADSVLSAVFHHFMVRRPVITADDVASSNPAEPWRHGGRHFRWPQPHCVIGTGDGREAATRGWAESV